MAQSKSEEKRVETQSAQNSTSSAPTPKYKYLDPACSGTAIETSNKMLNVEVDCKNCGKRLTLDDENNYVAL